MNGPVRLSVSQSFSQCSFHRIITKFSGDITIDKTDGYAKGRGQRSRSQRSKQMLPQFGDFRTVTLVLIHRWLRNYVHRLKWHRRCAPLFFKVIRLISRSHHQFDPDFSGEEVPYSFSRSSVQVHGHSSKKYQFGLDLNVQHHQAGSSYQIPQVCLV